MLNYSQRLTDNFHNKFKIDHKNNSGYDRMKENNVFKGNFGVIR